jgi:hypothetical protein
MAMVSQASCFIANLVEIREIDQTEDVTVHHHERLSQLVPQKREWSRGTERFGFLADRDAYAVLRTVPDEAFEIIGLVVGGEKNLIESVLFQPLDLDFENRLFTDWEQRFRDDLGEWSQSDTQTACENDCFHNLPLIFSG